MSRIPHYSTLRNNTHAKWWKDSGLRMSMFHIMILYSAVFGLGYDGALLNGLQSIAQWQEFFGRPTGVKLGLISAAYYLPKIPMAFLCPIITDKYGRKIPLYLGAFFELLGAIIGGTSINTGMLVGSRVCIGIGTALVQVATLSLLPELAHPRLRHLAGSFYNTTYFVGSIMAAWFTFGMVFYPDPTSNNAWRAPVYLQALGAVFIGGGGYLVPQSPRWLVRQGKEHEAHAILAKYHANGDMDDELVQFEMREIKANVRIEETSSGVSFAAWFQTRSNIRRFLMIVLLGTLTQWAGNGIISYYLVPVLRLVSITAPPQTAGINGGLSIFQWICALAGAGMVERLGRRKLFLYSIGGMFFCMAAMTGISGGYASNNSRSLGLAIIPFLFLFQGSYSIAITPLPSLYCPEISPLHMRARAGALLLLTQACSQTFNQFINPLALASIAWKYYFVYLGLLVGYFVLVFRYLRETRGLTAEEAAVVYEDDAVREEAIREEERLRAAEGLSQMHIGEKHGEKHLEGDVQEDVLYTKQ